MAFRSYLNPRFNDHAANMGDDAFTSDAYVNTEEVVLPYRSAFEDRSDDDPMGKHYRTLRDNPYLLVIKDSADNSTSATPMLEVTAENYNAWAADERVVIRPMRVVHKDFQRMPGHCIFTMVGAPEVKLPWADPRFRDTLRM